MLGDDGEATLAGRVGLRPRVLRGWGHCVHRLLNRGAGRELARLEPRLGPYRHGVPQLCQTLVSVGNENLAGILRPDRSATTPGTEPMRGAGLWVSPIGSLTESNWNRAPRKRSRSIRNLNAGG